MNIDKMKQGLMAGVQEARAAEAVQLSEPVLPRIVLPELPVDQNLASEFHRRLVEWINNFGNELDDEHEIGVRLVSFGQTITFHLEDIGYWNPSLIQFCGNTENGEPVELIQHVSQISILLMKVKRQDLSQPKRPIGFGKWEEEEKSPP